MLKVPDIMSWLLPVAHAQFVNPVSANDPKDLVANLALLLLQFAAPLAVAGVIWGGVQYIMAFGNEKKVESAKHVIVSSIIGLIIVLLAGFIVFFVSGSL